MALVRDISDNIHIVRDYSVPHTTFREDALRWIVRAAQRQEVKVSRIEIEDFESSKNTIAESLSQIGSEDAFVARHKSSSAVCVSIAGECDSRPFLLSISLESGVVGLICWENSPAGTLVLERIFALV